MPIFKTNQDIFKTLGEEVFNPNWNNYDTVQLPPNPLWDNSRELQVEDVDIWEVIYEGGGGNALYAAWCPYAKFFMLRHNFNIETYYGDDGEKRLEKRLKDLKIDYPRI